MSLPSYHGGSIEGLLKGPVKKNRWCPTCKTNTDQHVAKTFRVSGAEAFGWWCAAGHFTPQANGGHWIKKEALAVYVDLATLPVIESTAEKRPCARCGQPGTEDHHWAPQALFEDASEWPMSPLCLRCHQRWHSIMDAHRQTL